MTTATNHHLTIFDHPGDDDRYHTTDQAGLTFLKGQGVVILFTWRHPLLLWSTTPASPRRIGETSTSRCSTILRRGR